MTKLSAKNKRVITDDWLEAFPAFGFYKNMWLLRRVGPLLQGIYLDRDSSNSNYLPTFHVHNLIGQDGDFVSLSLRSVLKKSNGASKHITWIQHEKQMETIFEEFNEQAPLALSGNLSCGDVIDAYQREMSSGRFDVKYPLNQWHDIISILCWCGKRKEASDLLEEIKKEISCWPEDVCVQMTKRIERLLSLECYIESQQNAESKVNHAVKELNLDKLNFSSLLLD